MWIVPYRFVQRMTGDVDFRIMGTFIEFYTTLLGFVNYRLYSSIGLVYPPRFSKASDEQGAELGAFSLEGVRLEDLTIKDSTSAAKPSIDIAYSNGMLTIPGRDDAEVERSETQEILEHGNQDAYISPIDAAAETLIDQFQVAATDGDILPQPQLSGPETSDLFASMHVFISRESPRHPLEFVLKSFGCKRVSWDAVLGGGSFTQNEKEQSITHQIVDRPSMPSENRSDPLDSTKQDGDVSVFKSAIANRYPSRTYVQPQWIWDCINAGKLLRPDLYAPGTILPPHLSPWVKHKDGVYDPTIPLADQEPEGEALEDEVEEVPEGPQESEVGRPEEISGSERDNSSEEPDDALNEVSSQQEMSVKDALLSEQPQNDPEDIYQAELEAEATGSKFPKSVKDSADSSTTTKGIMPMSDDTSQRREIKKRQAEEELERRLGMASRRGRKLYGRIMHGINAQQEEASRLHKKRRRLEKAQETS